MSSTTPGPLSRATVSTRLSLGFATVVLLGGVSAGMGVVGLHQAGGTEERLGRLNRTSHLAGEAKFLTADFAGWQTGYAFDHRRGVPRATDDDFGQRAEFVASTAHFREVLDALDAADLRPYEARLVDDARTSMDAFMAIDGRIVAGYRAGDAASQEASDALASGESLDVFGHLAGDIDELSGSLSRRSDAAVVAAQAAARRLQVAVAVAAALLTLAGVLIARRTTRSVTVPLARCRAVLTAVTGGDLTRRTGPQPGAASDLARMAQDVDAVVDALHSSMSELSTTVERLVTTSGSLHDAGSQVRTIAAGTASRSARVAAAAEQVSGTVHGLAGGSAQVAASVTEIGRSTVHATSVATQAVDLAGSAAVQVDRLRESSVQIGDVLALISTIAEQTNLLALNATIEAARAGEHGRGFAVVATEVKALAGQSAQAVDEIRDTIQVMRATTDETAEGLGRIASIIDEIHGVQATVSGAIEEQAAATAAMGAAIQDAAAGTVAISTDLSGGAADAEEVSALAARNTDLADDLGELAAALSAVTGRFRLR